VLKEHISSVVKHFTYLVYTQTGINN